jgi:23S rRNA pseudouridine2605 synthase
MADRLQKILARAGLGSRRACEDLLRQGRVTVNGKVATLGDSADLERDAVKIDGKRVTAPVAQRYLLLNKPKGYITTKSDPEGRPTVMELVPPPWRKGLVPVGRLDFNTEGLLLLTSDGDFAQRVSHPRYGCRKSYAVKVKGHPDRDTVKQLREGVVIDGRRTAPARVQSLDRAARRKTPNSWWSVDIGEGRTRQIREMFFRVGHSVLKLKRVAIGGLQDPRLPSGRVRELTLAEIDLLMGREPDPAAARGRRARLPGGAKPRAAKPRAAKSRRSPFPGAVRPKP